MECFGSKPDNKQNSLLVIDDDSQTLMLISGILEGTRINIIESNRGTEAFKIFKKFQHKIGLILLDIYLPGCDGWTLAKKIRQINANIPIMAISAILPAELAENCRSLGLNGYFPKPLDLNRLKETIIYLLCDAYE